MKELTETQYCGNSLSQNSNPYSTTSNGLVNKTAISITIVVDIAVRMMQFPIAKDNASRSFFPKY